MLAHSIYESSDWSGLKSYLATITDETHVSIACSSFMTAAELSMLQGDWGAAAQYASQAARHAVRDENRVQESDLVASARLIHMASNALNDKGLAKLAFDVASKALIYAPCAEAIARYDICRLAVEPTIRTKQRISDTGTLKPRVGSRTNRTRTVCR